MVPRWYLVFGYACLSVGVGQANAQPVAPASAALAAVLHDYTEDQLKHSPQLATARGDHRYDDQLDDLSAREVNDRLARERAFLDRLGAIDPVGLNAQERSADEQLLTTLVEDQQRAPLKEWETPLDPAHGFQTRLLDLPKEAPVATVKDYDDYVARLRKIPAQFRQVTENMQLGIDEGRVQPVSTIEVVAAQINSVAAEKPEASVFAALLKRFPASIPAATRQRIADDLLTAIQDDVLPAYTRFGRFLRAQAIPAAQKQAAAK